MRRVIAAHDLYCCLLPVRSFAHMLLGLSNRNNASRSTVYMVFDSALTIALLVLVVMVAFVM